MKPVQCKNCKHFVRNIFYKSEGICNNDGMYTREHRVCDLLDTDEKKRNAKIKPLNLIRDGRENKLRQNTKRY